MQLTKRLIQTISKNFMKMNNLNLQMQPQIPSGIPSAFPFSSEASCEMYNSTCEFTDGVQIKSEKAMTDILNT